MQGFGHIHARSNEPSKKWLCYEITRFLLLAHHRRFRLTLESLLNRAAPTTMVSYLDSKLDFYQLKKINLVNLPKVVLLGDNNAHEDVR